MALLPYLYQAYGDYHRKGIVPCGRWSPTRRRTARPCTLKTSGCLAPSRRPGDLNANSFSNYTRQVVDDAKRFRPLNGPCRIAAGRPCAIDLTMDFDGLGIKDRIDPPLIFRSGRASCDSPIAPDAGNAGIRLWTP